MLKITPKVQYNPIRSIDNISSKSARKYKPSNSTPLPFYNPPKEMNIFQKIARFVKFFLQANSHR